jgi:hypothetical protein
VSLSELLPNQEFSVVAACSACIDYYDNFKIKKKMAKHLLPSIH